MIMISKSLILRDHIPHRCVGPLMCVDLCSDWSGVCFRKPYPLLPSGTCSFRVLPHGPSWEPSRVVRQHFTTVQFSSVQFSSVAQSCPTLCDPMNCSTPGPCPSPTPRVHSNSRPLSQCCHPAISSSVVPFSSCPQSLPALKSSPMSQLFA